jgi:hypothetical protein
MMPNIDQIVQYASLLSFRLSHILNKSLLLVNILIFIFALHAAQPARISSC